MSFKPISPKPDFVEVEHRVLEFWEKHNILQKYLHRNDIATKRFSFLDGPITANNPMGVHHAWGRTLKDLYQRFRNMQGFRQRFQNGFDNQGLWVEVEVERKLGFRSKKDIEKYGIARFVEECKKHTLKFSKTQTEQSKRLGYFMDWGNDYYTMSDENNYAIWHFLKKVWTDGNLYKGRDAVPWCPRCGTAISQHEILTEEYKELTHDAVFLRYPLSKTGERNPFQSPAVDFLVWTTTPWTIPGNVALAVNPKAVYVEVDIKSNGSRHLVLAKSRLEVLGRSFELIKEFPGVALEGLKYEGPYDDLAAVAKAREEKPETFHSVVLSEELVSEEEGTGIVHIASGAGTEDFRLGLEVGLPVIAVIDEAANYLDGFGEFSGKNAKNRPELIIGDLRQREDGRFLYRVEPCTHRYPTCWRCKSELVWRVVDEWYIAMDDARWPGAQNYRRKLTEIIKEVRWIPSFGYDRELDWLRNMEDWLISKKRYWGLALPIWECTCGNFEVIGSKEELRERAVEGWEEFDGHTPHRPWVDKVKIRCSKCGRSMSRILDVGNPWLDAGIVPFSTLKYFEDREYWRRWFPADLVLECFPGQFKNWFYSLLAMSGVLEGRAPYKTLLGHELVKDEHGEEMHKSKGNAIWFDEAAEKMGVDVMRWLYVTQDPTRALLFGYGPADEVRRRFFLILWNCYKFFTVYATLDGFDPTTPPEDYKDKSSWKNAPSVLDRWIMSRLANLLLRVTADLDDYRNAPAARKIEDFVVGDLSTWYIRRIRDRVGPSVPQDVSKSWAHATLYTVLITLTRILAPFIPFLAEEMYQNLSSPAKKTDFLGNRTEESVHLCSWPKLPGDLADSSLEEAMQSVREICEYGHAERRKAGIKVRQPLAHLTVRGRSALPEELVTLIKDELNVKAVSFEEGNGNLELALDTEITDDLRLEGVARELVRQIQDARREAGCNLDDRITVTYPESDENKAAVEKFGDYIRRETLSKSLQAGESLSLHVVGN